MSQYEFPIDIVRLRRYSADGEERKMPDDDRFEPLLRGRGWRSAYRLATGNSETNLLVDSFIKAAAHALRNQAQSLSLSKVATVLCESLHIPSLHDGRTLSGLEAFEHLSNGLEDIGAKDRSHVGTQLAIRAAERVFVEQARQMEVANTACSSGHELAGTQD
jgi:hypothetical protein